MFHNAKNQNKHLEKSRENECNKAVCTADVLYSNMKQGKISIHKMDKIHIDVTGTKVHWWLRTRTSNAHEHMIRFGLQEPEHMTRQCLYKRRLWSPASLACLSDAIPLSEEFTTNEIADMKPNAKIWNGQDECKNGQYQYIVRNMKWLIWKLMWKCVMVNMKMNIRYEKKYKK